jgi:acyl-CoA thioesterase-1
VIIELGANDGLRGFGFGQIRANLKRLVQLARASGSQVLLVGIRLPPNYGAAYVERFQAVFRDLADEEQIPFVPYLLVGVAENWELMQADGLHPSAAAQPRLLENVWPHLEPLVKQQLATVKGSARESAD